VRPLICSIVALFLAPFVGLHDAGGQEPPIAPKHHPWGAYRSGAWQQVRVETETLDEKGHVASKSTTEKEPSLVRVEKDGITLRLEAAVEVAGKRFDTEPQLVKQGFHGEPACHELKVKETKAGQITIEGRIIPCRIVQLECTGPNSKTATSLYYSSAVRPYILRRQSVTTDLQGKTTQSETTVSVVALSMPCKVLDEIKNGALLRAVTKHPKGTIITWTYTSTAVPGGVVSYSSKELDRENRLIRRSTLSLTGYGLQIEPQRVGLFGRKRGIRFRKSKP